MAAATQSTTKAERRPPARVGHKLAAVLPEILDPMTGEAEHQHPRRSGDARGGDHDKGCGDSRLDYEAQQGRPAGVLPGQPQEIQARHLADPAAVDDMPFRTTPGMSIQL